MAIEHLESTSSRDSQKIQVKLDALDAERAQIDEAFLRSLAQLRVALDQWYETKSVLDSSKA